MALTYLEIVYFFYYRQCYIDYGEEQLHLSAVCKDNCFESTYLKHVKLIMYGVLCSKYGPSYSITDTIFDKDTIHDHQFHDGRRTRALNYAVHVLIDCWKTFRCCSVFIFHSLIAVLHHMPKLIFVVCKRLSLSWSSYTDLNILARP